MTGKANSTSPLSSNARAQHAPERSHRGHAGASASYGHRHRTDERRRGLELARAVDEGPVGHGEETGDEAGRGSEAAPSDAGNRHAGDRVEDGLYDGDGRYARAERRVDPRDEVGVAGRLIERKRGSLRPAERMLSAQRWYRSRSVWRWVKKYAWRIERTWSKRSPSATQRTALSVHGTETQYHRRAISRRCVFTSPDRGVRGALPSPCGRRSGRRPRGSPRPAWPPAPGAAPRASGRVPTWNRSARP